jgi:DNA primase catalytic subunit
MMIPRKDGYPLDACAALWRMLSVSGIGAATRREFAVAKHGKDDGRDFVKRHLSFTDKAEFCKFVASERHFRLDVGSVCAIPPAEEDFFPPAAQEVVSRELRFDIDAGDYDNVEKSLPGRTCCSGRDTCASCWGIIATGCVIIDAGLRGQGARHIGWFFSGGRGMHCWVLDGGPFSSPEPALARFYVDEAAPADRVSLLASAVECGVASATEVITRLLFPQLAPLVRLPTLISEPLANPTFAASPRGVFLGWYAARHPDSFVYALRTRLAAVAAAAGDDVLPSEAATAQQLSKQFAGLTKTVRELADGLRMARARANGTSDVSIHLLDQNLYRVFVVRFESALDEAEAVLRREGPSMFRNGRLRPCSARAIIEAGLVALMPRVDSAVTTEANHLLKAPMSVHAGTGRLAVRVDSRNLLSFRPWIAPKRQLDGNFDDDRAARQAFADFDDWTKAMKHELRT